MVKYQVIISIALISNIFLSCSNSSEFDKESQLIIVQAYYQSYYYDQINHITVRKPSADVVGFCYADPLPEFHYIKAGEIISTECYYSMYQRSELRFDNFGEGLIVTNINPLMVEVSTSIGKLSGSISVPDTVQDFITFPSDSLNLGQSLYFEWGGQADFYNLRAYYRWKDSNGEWDYFDLSRFVEGNSITFADSIFTKNGEIYSISLEPANGPVPKTGSTGNMSGAGIGYLYFIQSKIYLGNVIVVGEGLIGEENFKNSLNQIETKDLIQQEILKRH